MSIRPRKRRERAQGSPGARWSLGGRSVMSGGIGFCVTSGCTSPPTTLIWLRQGPCADHALLARARRSGPVPSTRCGAADAARRAAAGPRARRAGAASTGRRAPARRRRVHGRRACGRAGGRHRFDPPAAPRRRSPTRLRGRPSTARGGLGRPARAAAPAAPRGAAGTRVPAAARVGDARRPLRAILAARRVNVAGAVHAAGRRPRSRSVGHRRRRPSLSDQDPKAAPRGRPFPPTRRRLRLGIARHAATPRDTSVTVMPLGPCRRGV